MSKTLFEKFRLGSVELPNRFVRSATYESMASAQGAVTRDLVRYYRRLGNGRIGAIISGFAYVSPPGKSAPFAMGIDSDDRIEGLRQMVDAGKADGSAFFVQLGHAGGQATKRFLGHQPLAPSSHLRNPMYFEKPHALTGREIARIIDDFGTAAARAMDAGADGIQLHGAHGYLIAEFLSPFFNKRSDEWGGSPDNRFRFLRELILSVRSRAGDHMPVLVKIVHDDGTPEPGMTTELAADVAARLAELGIAGLELSAGGTCWAPFRMCRGDVPVNELVQVFPWPLRPIMRRRFRAMVAKGALKPNYNAEAAKVVKEALGDVPLILVGGLRELKDMEELVSSGKADLIALSRPLVRQPHLVKRFAEIKDTASDCISCNRCLAAIFNGLPLRCYVNGLPK
jgi:2,4-dienoyl-CoA reductase-like NADH-dependent reductase (Old Yellow Enzyme family)